MPLLTAEQRRQALELLHSFLNAPAGPNGQVPREEEAILDQNRVALIEQTLAPLLQSYLTGGTSLSEFKSKIDSINKRNRYWGFKGIKGQMFFNQVVNTASSSEECDVELKAALAIPSNEDVARSRIRTFTSYVKRISAQHVESGGNRYQCPKLGSVPFFLSYFWQIQDRNTWPVYYTNSTRVMEDTNLWQPTDDEAENYVTYKQIHEELIELFSRESGQPFDLYQVEHVFWLKGGNPFTEDAPAGTDAPPPTQRSEPTADQITRLPESYVPPIIAILPRIAQNDPAIVEAARRSATSLERAFEKNIHAAFTILGFETTLLGQGQGRVPDGLAVDHDNLYGLMWDGKVRGDGYSMGTDDRTIREYISTQSREWRRRRSLRNIYYAIVSSSFKDDFDDAVRMLKMETEISEVCLIEADALVALVDLKLREPRQLSLGPDGIQRIFASSGVITADDVREMLE